MNKLFLLLVINILISITTGVRNFHFKGTKAECKIKQPNYLESFYCFLEELNNRSLGSGHIMFHNPESQLNVHFVVLTKPRNARRIKLIDMRFDLCSIFAGIKADKIFSIGNKYIKRFMNEIPHCPLKAHFNYTLTKGYFDEEDFPTYTPNGDFQFAMRFYNQKVEAGSYIYQGKVVPA